MLDHERIEVIYKTIKEVLKQLPFSFENLVVKYTSQNTTNLRPKFILEFDFDEFGSASKTPLLFDRSIEPDVSNREQKNKRLREDLLELIKVVKDHKKPCYFANDNDVKLWNQVEKIVRKHV